MAAADALIAQAKRLRAEISSHKGEIRRRKQQLHAAAADLADLEAQCRRLGIHLIVVNPSGAGDVLHGRPDSDS